MIITYFYIFLTALLTAVVLVPPVSRAAFNRGLLDHADSRKVHTTATPRLGGVAIFFGTLLAILLFLHFDRKLQAFVTGGLVIFLTGLADDLRGLTPRQKFVGEILAASFLVVGGGTVLHNLGNLFGSGVIELGTLAVPFTIFCIVGVINAINLLDGLDGLAGGTSVIACAAFGVLGYSTGNTSLVALSAGVAGGILGFLKFNTYPARIFMGDSGSLFLGYCMGAFAVMSVDPATAGVSPVAPLIILAVPVLDTIFVMGRRKLQGKRLFSPDRTHFHHRLLDLGFGHKFTVIIVYGITYILAIFAVFGRDLPDYQLLLALIVGGAVICGVLGGFARRIGSKTFGFLSNDGSFTDSAIYRLAVQHMQKLTMGVYCVLVAFLVLAAAAPVSCCADVGTMAILLLIFSVVLFFVGRNTNNRFFLLLCSFNGAFIIYHLENAAANGEAAGIVAATNILLAAVVFLAGARFFIHRNIEEIIDSPLEYLLLLILIAVPLLPEDVAAAHHLLTVVAKSAVLFVAYKMIANGKAVGEMRIMAASLVPLLALVVRSFQ